MVDYYIDPVAGSDGNAGTSPGSGNAWQTLANTDDSAAIITGSDHVYIKASGNVILNSIPGDPTLGISSTVGAVFTGYTSTITDGGKATLQVQTGYSGTYALTVSGRIENLILDSNGNATSAGNNGIQPNSSLDIINCTIQGFGYSGIILGSTPTRIFNTIVKSCNTAGGTAAIYSSSGNPSVLIFGCKVFSNSLIGIGPGLNSKVVACQVYSNGGDGIYGVDFALGNTVHGNTGYGLLGPSKAFNNIITNNGGYGISGGAGVDLLKDYNFLGSGALANTSGAYATMSAGPHDLSGNPQYVNAGTADFTPQNAAAHAAFPSGWMGAVQPAGGSSSGPVGRSLIITNIGTY